MRKGKKRRGKQVPEVAKRSEKKPSMAQMEETEKRAQHVGCKSESRQPIHVFGHTTVSRILWLNVPSFGVTRQEFQAR